MDTQDATKRIALYLVLVFSLSTVLYFLIVRMGVLIGLVFWRIGVPEAQLRAHHPA